RVDDGSRARRLLVRDQGNSVFVDPAEVRWFEVYGNYLRLAVGSRQMLMRSTLETMAAQLDGTSFIRISRSVIVNLQHVRSVRRHENGQYEFLLTAGGSLRGSRRYRREVRRALGR